MALLHCGGMLGAQQGGGSETFSEPIHRSAAPTKLKEADVDKVFRNTVGTSRNVHSIFIHFVSFANIR